jgi:hypothetical protein
VSSEEPQRFTELQKFKFLCQCIGVTATQALTCQPILSRHYTSKLNALRRPRSAGTALSRLISSTRRHSAPWAEQLPLFSHHSSAKRKFINEQVLQFTTDP